MYTRSRQGQNTQNFNQGSRQMNNQNSPQFQGQAYSPQSKPQSFKNQQLQGNKPIQQQQAKPNQQQQAKPNQQQQAKPVPVQNQSPVAPPQPQRLKPILKQAAPAPQPIQPNVAPPQQVNTAEVKNEAETVPLELDGPEHAEPARRWKRKAPGLKINRKLKRMRLNQRLRKTLQPKNAIMVLNEMKTGVQFTFPETQASMNSSLFLVHAEIEGKTYVGQGLSKPLARQNAAENALKSLLLEKMTAASMRARIDAESDGQSQNSDATDANGENADGTSMEVVEEADEIPWSSLASFALYKLFLEWQNQGTVVPVPRPGVSPGKVKAREHKPIVQKELPMNATTIHPVMLLNQMRPGLTYVESERVGNPPNTIFTLAVEIDGVEYKGTAKNKRDAKKAAAKTALQALFNLMYPEDMVQKNDADGDVVML